MNSLLHIDLIRYIFLMLELEGRQKASRNIFINLKKCYHIKNNSMNNSNNNNNNNSNNDSSWLCSIVNNCYHESIIYFWIQTVDEYRKLFEQNKSIQENKIFSPLTQAEKSNDDKTIFRKFLELYPIFHNSDYILEYYSLEILQDNNAENNLIKHWRHF